ncbi:MAG: permease prefix domain 1-containing protein [Phycisphaerales bacterium]
MSTRPLKLSEAAAPREAADAVASWLRVLEPLLKLPDRERSAIVEELDSHLRERIRDQMLAGVPESQAVRAAIGELGDAALLARRFRAAGRSPLRRLAMNTLVLGVAGAALVTSIVAVRGPGVASNPAVYQPEPAVMKGADGSGKQVVDEIALQGATLEQALMQIAKGAGLKLFIHRDGPGNDGLEEDDSVTLLAHRASLERLFELINEKRSSSAKIDFRVVGSTLEVASRAFFDRRDTQLVSFDIAPILNAGIEADRLIEAITSMVEMEHWEENGGETGRMTVVGERLFVSAPPRMWRQAAWMIEQLGGGQPGHEARGPERAGPTLTAQPILAQRELPILRLRAEKAAADDAANLEKQIKHLRRELAWRKVMLGAELTAEDRAAMDDSRAVKAVGPDDPRRKEVEAEAAAIRLRLFELAHTYDEWRKKGPSGGGEPGPTR